MFELNQKREKTEGNLKRVLSKYWKYWYLFLIGVVVCIGLAFLYIRYEAVPKYRITGTVLIKDKDKGEDVKTEQSLGDLGLVKASKNIEDQIGILKSTDLMERVLLELSLNVRYQVTGQINDLELYSKNLAAVVEVIGKEIPVYDGPITIIPNDFFFYELHDFDEKGNIRKKQYRFGDTITAPEGKFRVVRNTELKLPAMDTTPLRIQFLNVEAMAADYIKQIIIEPINKTGSLIGLSLLDPLPKRGEDVVRMLIEMYAEETVKYQNQLAISTIEIIDERLKGLSGDIVTVEQNIATYKQQNDLTNVSSDAAVYLERAQESNRKLQEYQTQIDVLNSIEGYLNQGNSDASLVPSSLNLQDPTLLSLISRFNERQSDKKSLLRTTPASNPLIVNIERDLVDLREDILENLQNIKQGLLIAQDNVRSNYNRARARIAKVPSAELELSSINRDQGIKQELYLYLLQKREEEALSLAAPISNVRIVDSPKAGKFPESPNKTSIYLGALILGLFIPFSFVYVKEELNDKVCSTQDIEDRTLAPLLGMVSASETEEVLVATENNSAPVAELFRLMRFNLKFLSNGKPRQVLLVTSGKKGEGKTFLTLNLAASLALAGHRVVALSFDLRAPKLMQDLDMVNAKGITDYLVDSKVALSDITVPMPGIDNLFLIDSGPTNASIGELMLHERIESLIAELRKIYDYVLIDSAPVGKVADAYALAPYTDASIYVVRQDYSGREELEILDDIYRKEKLKHPMVVFNGVSTMNTYGYGKDRPTD